MKRTTLVIGLLVAATAAVAAAGDPVVFTSPGFPPSRMDADGRLIEDWGTVGVKLLGEGVADGPVTVEATKLDDLIPAARAVSARGAVKLTWTAYRAPAFPSGIDVLSVRVEETHGQPAKITVALDVPPQAKIGLSTVTLDKRIVLSVPKETVALQEVHDWGYCNETTAMPGWAKPQGPCDPAFANIRAGMGGLPILYRFKVAPKSQANVVLGFCESHWEKPGKRPVICDVEGARRQEVDPIAMWGQHKPGALLFRAKDLDGDGRLEVAVRPVAGAADRNTILNAIWVFAPSPPPNLQKVVAGDLSKAAVHYVDVGGANDQSIYALGKLEYPVSLPAHGAQELTFFVACPGGSAFVPETSAWTADTLRRAAADVWRAWTPRP